LFCISCPCHPSVFDQRNNIRLRTQIIKSVVLKFCPRYFYFSTLMSKCSSNVLSQSFNASPFWHDFIFID
jgi:hypothetical protein